MSHIHLHLHTKDAGTSEGARKAAQTRAQHGGTPARGGFEAAAKQHEQHANRHEASAARYRNTGNREAAQAHGSAAEAHYHAAQAYRSVNQGRPANATLARRQATQATRATRFGAGDSGTSEGARKAAQTRAEHHGQASQHSEPQKAAHKMLLQHGHEFTHRTSAASGSNYYRHPKTNTQTVVHQNGSGYTHTPRTNRNSSFQKLTPHIASQGSYGVHDAGTSEGARKAAQTRKQHGGGSTLSQNIARASGREQQIRHHEAQAAHHGKVAATFKSVGGFYSKQEAREHTNAMHAHRAASEYHRTGSPEAPARSKYANSLTKKLGTFPGSRPQTKLPDDLF